MQLVLARNYIENLREEVKKGMREKAAQGVYPGRAPFGYRNNKTDRTVEVHSENAQIVIKIFEMYASGQFSLSLLAKAIRSETGRTFRGRTYTPFSRIRFIAEISPGAGICTVGRTTLLSASIFTIACKLHYAHITNQSTASKKLHFEDF